MAGGQQQGQCRRIDAVKLVSEVRRERSARVVAAVALPF
jgi:hypothetical protein